MLRAVGFEDADFEKPQVAVCSAWSMVTPCNAHLDELSKRSVVGVDEAGGKALPFGTITVSDGISMGTPGMRYSLISREVIADSIETVVGAEGMDGVVAIGGCDKNMPACIMALSRLNRPGDFCLRRHHPSRHSQGTELRYRIRIRGRRRPLGGQVE